MALGFTLADRNDTTFLATLREMIAKPSTQFAGGDALVFTAGRAEQAATATAAVDAILNCIKIPPSLARPATANLTTTLGELAQYIPVRGTGLIFKTFLTGASAGDSPPINGVLCNANTDKSVVLVPYTGTTANDDFTGGTVYANGEQRTISSSTYSGGVHTLNVNTPFTVAITTTHYAYVVPFSKGTRGVRLNPNTVCTGISTAVAGKSGGKVNIEDVFLTDRVGYSHSALVSFQD